MLQSLAFNYTILQWESPRTQRRVKNGQVIQKKEQGLMLKKRRGHGMASSGSLSCLDLRLHHRNIPRQLHNVPFDLPKMCMKQLLHLSPQNGNAMMQRWLRQVVQTKCSACQWVISGPSLVQVAKTP